MERRVLRTPAAAKYAGMSTGTFEKYRVYGGGPRFVRIGPRAIGYTIEDLDAYIEAGRRTSTSDPGANPQQRNRPRKLDPWANARIHRRPPYTQFQPIDHSMGTNYRLLPKWHSEPSRWSVRGEPRQGRAIRQNSPATRLPKAVDGLSGPHPKPATPKAALRASLAQSNAADHHGAAGVAMGGLARRIMNIARVDVLNACIHSDLSRHA
jgi:predicted DNA-binding transcriptional regulator AlpA